MIQNLKIDSTEIHILKNLKYRERKAYTEYKTIIFPALLMICDHFFYWQDHARTFDSYEQWAIAEFAEALSTIPKTLAINAAMDAIDLLAALRVTWMKQKLSNREDDGEGEGFCDVLWLNYILDQLVDQYFLFISVYFDDIYSTFSTPPFCLSPATLFFLDIYELR